MNLTDLVFLKIFVAIASAFDNNAPDTVPVCVHAEQLKGLSWINSCGHFVLIIKRLF
jgi:hypothetical protein